MRRGIFQLILVALVLLHAVASEKDANKTSDASSEKDIAKEETGRISFRMHPDRGYGASKSSSHSKSSSKSSGSGSGQGYGYGSNGPQDKGPSGGYRGPSQHSYSPSYDEEHKGSVESYKSSGDEQSYRRPQHHYDSSHENSGSYEEPQHYDNRGHFSQPHQSGKSHLSKSYTSNQNRNKGYSSSGTYSKDDDDLPSVSPDGFIESHSSQQSSAEKPDGDLRQQGYGGAKDSYGGQSYQGNQGGSHLSGAQGYGEYSGRDVNVGYSGPSSSSYGGFVPMANAGGLKQEPYSNTIGKEIDANKLSLFIKQLGSIPLSQIQGKNIYESGEGKYGPEKDQQQGFLLFPLVPKGQEGGVSLQGGGGGYGGRDPYPGQNDGKNTYGVLKDAGYSGPGYTSHLSGNYGPQENSQGREYVGTSGGYGLGGHQGENVGYQQDKAGYGQSHQPVSEGKNYAGNAGMYGNQGSYPKQHEPSVGGGLPGKVNYGSSVREADLYGVSGGVGYGSPSAEGKLGGQGPQYPVKSGPTNEGYGYGITSSGGAGYKNSGSAGAGYKNAGSAGASAGGYTNTGSLQGKDYPREYMGVVNFAGGQSHGYAGGSQGKSGPSYDSAGHAGAGYGQIEAGLGQHGPGKSYPMVGYIGGGGSASPAAGYGDISSRGVDQPVVNAPASQPIAPKDKKSKSVAIILQKQPINEPSLRSIGDFGPQLEAQFKSPFKDYLGGGGFDLGLGNYGSGLSGFDAGFRGRDTTDLLHGLDGYGAGLSPFTYANDAKFY